MPSLAVISQQDFAQIDGIVFRKGDIIDRNHEGVALSALDSVGTNISATTPEGTIVSTDSFQFSRR